MIKYNVILPGLNSQLFKRLVLKLAHSRIDTFLYIFLYFFFLLFFRAALARYGSSQARGGIGVTAAGLCHSHSNAESETSLQATPQLMATLGSLTH